MSIDNDIADKIEVIKTQYPAFDEHKIFPSQHQLSTGIDIELFSINHIKKPAFFIRVRPGKKNKVLEVLAKNEVKFQSVTESCLKLYGNVDIEALLDVDSDCVVQDYGSQQTFDVLAGVVFPKQLSIWDACAGSGGKAIMARDVFPQAKLYVSDIREDILEELEYRFKLAHIIPEKVFCTDLQHPLSSQVSISNLPTGGVDLIIADVPCTGSGTWGRSPEWLRSFDETLIDSYRQRQTSIVSRLPEQLKPGGYMLYITCSVFYQENESLVDFIQQTTKLKLVKQELISGITSESDTLFTALFILQA
jgi:16S rRNA (cytosine967-C5)-methyltransferase